MHQRDKVAVMFILSFGFLTSFATIYKTAAILPKLKYLQTDFSLVVGRALLWATVETSSAIIAGSVLTWGWVFRSFPVRQVIDWTKSQGLVVSGTSQRLGSQAGEADRESDRIKLRTPKQICRSGDGEGGHLQSMDRFERSVGS